MTGVPLPAMLLCSCLCVCLGVQEALESFRFPDPMEMRHELDKQASQDASLSKP